MNKLSVVIPVYNEADSLDELVERIFHALTHPDHEFEIVMVNDGSTDESAARLNALADAHPRVKVVHLRINYGQTAAMMAGFDHSSGDIVVPIDADLQNDPDDIPLLLDQIKAGYDVCSGWRTERSGSLLTRRLPSRFANWMISAISGVHLNDYGCSLKAYRREFIDDVHLYGEMHRFIPIYASWRGAKITEIPVRDHPRQHGTSSYGLERTFKVILDLIVVKFLSRYAEKPIYVFGGFGIFNMFCAFLSALGMVYYKFWGGKSFVETPLPILVAIFVAIGFGSILGGLIAELVMRTYYESQGKRVYAVEAVRNLEND